MLLTSNAFASSETTEEQPGTAEKREQLQRSFNNLAATAVFVVAVDVRVVAQVRLQIVEVTCAQARTYESLQRLSTCMMMKPRDLIEFEHLS